MLNVCCIVGPFKQSEVMFKKLLEVFQGADADIQVNQIKRNLAELAQPAKKRRRKSKTEQQEKSPARGSSKRSKRDVPPQADDGKRAPAKRVRKQSQRFDPALDGQNDRERLKGYKPGP